MRQTGIEIGLRKRLAGKELEVKYFPKGGIGIIDSIFLEQSFTRNGDNVAILCRHGYGLGLFQRIEAFTYRLGGKARIVILAPILRFSVHGVDIKHPVSLRYGAITYQLDLELQHDNQDHGHRQHRTQDRNHACKTILSQRMDGLFKVLLEHPLFQFQFILFLEACHIGNDYLVARFQAIDYFDILKVAVSQLYLPLDQLVSVDNKQLILSFPDVERGVGNTQHIVLDGIHHVYIGLQTGAQAAMIILLQLYRERDYTVLR